MIDTSTGNQRIITLVIYILFAFAFLGFIPAIIGLIIAYMKRSEMNALYRSHINQILRAFWWYFGISAILLLLTILTLGVAAIITWIPAGIIYLWFLYRLLKGFFRCLDERAY